MSFPVQKAAVVPDQNQTIHFYLPSSEPDLLCQMNKHQPQGDSSAPTSQFLSFEEKKKEKKKSFLCKSSDEIGCVKMSRNAASSVPFWGLAVAVIRAELSPLIWRSAPMNTAMNKAKEHVIPFPPGEGQGSRRAGSMRKSVTEKKKPSNNHRGKIHGRIRKWTGH